MGRTSLAAVVVAVALWGCEPDEGIVGGSSAGGSSSSSSSGPLLTAVATGASTRLLSDGRWVAVDTEGHKLRYFTRDGTTRLLQPAGTTILPPGSRPTWLAGTSRLALLLRGSGQLAWVTVGGSVSSRVDVCPEPRGVALDARETSALVACASGELVNVDSAGTVLSTIDTGLDLRDVVRVDESTAWVTTWRSAQLLQLDRRTGAVVTTLSPTTIAAAGGLTFSPHVAARTIVVGDDAFMVHQASLDQDVSLLGAGGATPTTTTPQYYGNLVPGACLTSVVTTAVTHFDLAKKTVLGTSPMPGSVPVDITSDGNSVVIATLGNSEVVRVGAWQLGLGCTTATAGTTPEPPVGVALDQGAMLVLTPNTLENTQFETKLVPEHPARALFRAQSPSGVACQSCHVDGYEDGHTWSFDHQLVRTQSLEGGLLRTAPFHWQGELHDLGAVLHLTLEARMGGSLPKALSPASFGAWLDQLPARKKPAVGASDSELIAQGQQIFQQAGCDSCHAGDSFTNNASVDVGSGGTFQVPSLRAVGFRGPWLHSGCAQTLEDRFVPGACAGLSHPTVPATSVAPLVRYLKSL